MTVNRKKYSLGYFLGKTLLLLLLVIPTINTLAAVITDQVFNIEEGGSAWLALAFSFIWYNWIMLIFVLIPYSLIYFYAAFIQKYLIVQFLVFYALLALSGFLIKDGSIIGIYTLNQYPRVWLLYFLITIAICPSCNYILLKFIQRKVDVR